MSQVTYKTFTLDTTAISPAGIEYLLQYGFAQSLQDCVAGRAKKVREEYATANAKALAEDGPEAELYDEAEIEAAVEADLAGAMAKRMDAIAAGTVAIRVGGGEAKDPTSGIVREILQGIAKAKGFKLPKADSDEYKAMASKVREAKAEYITSELARRAAAVEAFDIEL